MKKIAATSHKLEGEIAKKTKPYFSLKFRFLRTLINLNRNSILYGIKV